MAERLSDQLRRLASEATPGPWEAADPDGWGLCDIAPDIADRLEPKDAALIVLLVNNRDNITAIIDAAQKVTDLYVRSELDMETIGAIEEMDVVLAAFGAGQETGG